jgi:restriction system protein
MRRPKESFGDILLKLPWWISAILGIFSFAIMTWGSLAWAGHDNTRQLTAREIIPFSSVIFAFFGIHAAASYWFGRHCARLIDNQTSLESHRNLPWKQFEFMVTEAYRRQGYAVDYSFSRGADGGVDLVLRRDGRTSLVQCKKWKASSSVGVPVIREMFGLLTAEKADEAIIVTTGNFMTDAIEFAVGKPIRLIDGPQLLSPVQSVQNPTTVEEHAEKSTDVQKPPSCPQCGKPMVLRIARRGANAGNRFWGCSTYPACKGSLSF